MIDGFNSRLDEAEEKISELKYRFGTHPIALAKRRTEKKKIQIA